VLGGALTGTLGWEWVFGFNVPVCLALGLVAHRIVPRTPPEAGRAPFDVGGAVGSVLVVGALVFAIIEGRSRGWATPRSSAASRLPPRRSARGSDGSGARSARWSTCGSSPAPRSPPPA
jgi:hypothetical protein